MMNHNYVQDTTSKNLEWPTLSTTSHERIIKSSQMQDYREPEGWWTDWRISLLGKQVSHPVTLTQMSYMSVTSSCCTTRHKRCLYDESRQRRLVKYGLGELSLADYTACFLGWSAENWRAEPQQTTHQNKPHTSSYTMVTYNISLDIDIERFKPCKQCDLWPFHSGQY